MTRAQGGIFCHYAASRRSLLPQVLRVPECGVVRVPGTRRLDTVDRLRLPLVLRVSECGVARVPGTRRLDAAGAAPPRWCCVS
jgi:hypothetical protein